MRIRTSIQAKYNRDLCISLPKYDRGVSWLCWAYNEEGLVREYLIRANELLRQTVEDYEIVIIDDCSTDRTNEIIREVMKDIPQVRLIRNPTNMNVGYSSREAIKNARKEYLMWQTIDWSYDLSLFRVFLELLKSYDIVAGVRRKPVEAADKGMKPVLVFLGLFGIKHITRRSDTVPKAIISIINYILIRCLFRVPLSDYQNVVFYPRDLIQSIPFEAGSSFINPEGLIKSYWRGASIIEVPISFLPRQSGEAKGTHIKSILKSVQDIFTLWFKWIVLGQREIVRKGYVRRLNPKEWKVA